MTSTRLLHVPRIFKWSITLALAVVTQHVHAQTDPLDSVRHAAIELKTACQNGVNFERFSYLLDRMGAELAAMPQLELILAVGTYAQRWHLGSPAAASMTAAVMAWEAPLASPSRPRRLALPHPSWRNNAWLKQNAWFERDLLPRLRLEVRRLLSRG